MEQVYATFQGCFIQCEFFTDCFRETHIIQSGSNERGRDKQDTAITDIV